MPPNHEQYQNASPEEAHRMCPFLGKMSLEDVELMMQFAELGLEDMQAVESIEDNVVDRAKQSDVNIGNDDIQKDDFHTSEETLLRPIAIESTVAQTQSNNTEFIAEAHGVEAPDESQLRAATAYYESLQRMADDSQHAEQSITAQDSSYAKANEKESADKDVVSGSVHNVDSEPIAHPDQNVVSEKPQIIEEVAISTDLQASQEALHVFTDDEITEFVLSNADEEVIEPQALDQSTLDLPLVESKEIGSLVGHNEGFGARQEGEPSIFISEFTAEEAAELDEMLGFNGPVFAEDDHEFAQNITIKQQAEHVGDSRELGFAEQVHTYIEAMPESKFFEAQEAFNELEIIQELAAEFAVLKIDELADPEKVEELMEVLIMHTEKLLALLDKSSDARLTRRFIERVVLSELKKLMDAQLEPEDEGTHEKHVTFSRFVNDLIRLDGAAQRFSEALGKRALYLAVR